MSKTQIDDKFTGVTLLELQETPFDELPAFCAKRGITFRGRNRLIQEYRRQNPSPAVNYIERFKQDGPPCKICGCKLIVKKWATENCKITLDVLCEGPHRHRYTLNDILIS